MGVCGGSIESTKLCMSRLQQLWNCHTCSSCAIVTQQQCMCVTCKYPLLQVCFACLLRYRITTGESSGSHLLLRFVPHAA
jgi:hypothetical protein